MNTSQDKTPLYSALLKLKEKSPYSFHVPGHKFGKVFSERGKVLFQSTLEMDATEITGLDDLHAAKGVIKEAQELASQFFESDNTYFLVNGTTSGILAAVMSVCRQGETVIVQRNCHKSILHGLELAGAKPVFLLPDYEENTGRYSGVTAELVNEALKQYPDTRAVFLTYPDYFGRVFDIKKVCEAVHNYKIPVVVDEAHGVHFKLGTPFPASSIDLGGDLIIQSAHKMAPAMTMASYLHVKGDRVDQSRLRYYLQVFQSSSPSYPLMASLDLARHYLASFEQADKGNLLTYIDGLRQVWSDASGYWRLLPTGYWDDPLKLTLEARGGLSGFQLAEVLEAQHMYPELATEKQVLLTTGLAPTVNLDKLQERLEEVNCRLKKQPISATINIDQPPYPRFQTLDIDYADMSLKPAEFVDWKDAVNRICAEAVVPYPPGIPFILKGERVSKEQETGVKSLLRQGTSFQNVHVERGIWVF
ncbi:aminotransferase class I/II-fold pyridoxal phosphate-dependent enzyme [Halobacillus naozhouensis]|uniref:Aminotransferase class I/II-fold pyridoxal phosphate-dependent enzyme n=1 Tax=Halobacillus naozhouensis TaxID=554880 RepID=A0ABY8IZY0_9BACI|nr:aminotransferase class I/II-fold pyridoxal phosphate-dependent enzyme [Halobacillus naozhouensis]WFT74922.1 aminotransferase class I/II-fold pyridoxal phosphate-dependent enzyme [Halobacillus naozhouensis]